VGTAKFSRRNNLGRLFIVVAFIPQKHVGDAANGFT